MWVSIFGNSAIEVIRSGNERFGEIAMNQPEQGFYTLLQQYPAFPLIASLATFTGLLFYVTSADSAALVMANLTSYRRTPRDDASAPVRIFWAVATGVLTLAMLIVGGITALQNATIVMGLPFAFVMVLLMFGLYKALRVEAIRADSQRSACPRSYPGAQPGRRPPGRADLASAPEAQHELPGPRGRHCLSLGGRALGSDRGRRGVTRARRREGGVRRQRRLRSTYVKLAADLGAEAPFLYRIEPRETLLPVFGDTSLREAMLYYRLDVHLRAGGQGYDVRGYTHSQLIDDVLDQYEQHVEFMRLSAEATR